jgi:hypothetical protein
MNQIMYPLIIFQNPLLIVQDPYQNCIDSLGAMDTDELLKMLLVCMIRGDDSPGEDKNSSLGLFCFNHRRFVLSEFVRAEFKKINYQDFKMPKHWKRGVKELIRCEVNLLVQFWKLLRLTSIRKIPLPLYLYAVLQEKRLINLLLNPAGDTTTAAKKDLQSENRQLFLASGDRNYENCFSQDKEYYTHAFIQECIAKSQNSDSFCKEYLLFGELRMKYTTEVKKSSMHLLRGNTEDMEHRGRS